MSGKRFHWEIKFLGCRIWTSWIKSSILHEICCVRSTLWSPLVPSSSANTYCGHSCFCSFFGTFLGDQLLPLPCIFMLVWSSYWPLDSSNITSTCQVRIFKVYICFLRLVTLHSSSCLINKCWSWVEGVEQESGRNFAENTIFIIKHVSDYQNT